MVSVWSPGPSSPVPVGRGGIVGLSKRSGKVRKQVKPAPLQVKSYFDSKIRPA
ncbi:hypothetical protein YC2023_010338 [Brassica napus]